MFSRNVRQRVSSADPNMLEPFDLPEHRSTFSKNMFSAAHTRLKWLVSIIALVVSAWLLIARYRRTAEWRPSPPYPGPHHALTEEGVHGFLSLRDARDHCQRRRWEPYAARDQRRKVYDLFLINTELDFLEIRLNELDQEVDYFVVLESATTFQMNPKPLYLQENLSRFRDFQHKIIHRVLDDSGAKKIPQDDTWERERYTRYVCYALFLCHDLCLWICNRIWDLALPNKLYSEYAFVHINHHL